MDDVKKKLVFHVIVILFFIVSWGGLFHLMSKFKEMGIIQLKLMARFLTNWNFFFQFLLFVGYLIDDIFTYLDSDLQFMKRTKKLMDFYFYSICAPTSIFVSLAFWSMTAYDSSLIIPAGLETLLPVWLNHSLHTIISVNVILQTCFNKNGLTNTTKAAIAFIVFYVFYFLCIYETYYEVNVWIYPFLGRINEPYRSLFLVALFLLASLINVAYNWLNICYCNKIKTT